MPPGDAEAGSELAPPAGGRVCWTAPEILLIVFLAPNLLASLATEALRSGGFFAWYYGPQAAQLVAHPSPDSLAPLSALAALASPPPPGAPVPAAALQALLPPAAASQLPATRMLLAYRFFLWSNTLAFGFQIGSALLILKGFSGVSLRELGLTSTKPLGDVLLGAGAALLLTPLILGTKFLVVLLWKEWFSAGVQEHPFTQLGQISLFPAEWVLLILSAVALAPFWEELCFRGLLQPWLASRPFGGFLALALALVAALALRADFLLTAWQSGPLALLRELVPALVVLGLAGLLWLSRFLSPGDNRVGAALFGTAVLFSWVHVRAWPDPIPLLLLALPLGYLAWRTRSLVAPITLHSLFNAVSCVLLLVNLFTR